MERRNEEAPWSRLHAMAGADALSRSAARIAVLAWILLPVLLAGCAHEATSPVRSARVDSGLLVPLGASRYEMNDREAYFLPDRLPGHAELAYPADAPDVLDGVERVCIDVIVDEGGDVVAAAVNASGSICAPSARSLPFQEAALAAVDGWTFFAAQVCTFPEGMEHNDRCDGEGVVVRQLPVKLTYVFEFSLVDGAPAVRSTLK